MIEGSGSVPVTNGSGTAKNLRIRKTALKYRPKIFLDCNVSCSAAQKVHI
jgi:hypothetical protein